MKPNTAIALAIVICQVRSFHRPDDQDQKTEMIPAIRYGGHVKRRVMVVLNPRVLTAVGKKFLKPLAARCICCMNMNSQTLGSEAASKRPLKVEVLPRPPTVSFSIRACASCRSSGVNHFVVNGKSGRVNDEVIAMTPVTAPWRMKSHCLRCIRNFDLCNIANFHLPTM